MINIKIKNSIDCYIPIDRYYKFPIVPTKGSHILVEQHDFVVKRVIYDMNSVPMIITLIVNTR